MDSAIPQNSHEIEPQGQFDLGMVSMPTSETKTDLEPSNGLLSRKFILAMYIETIASIFTGLGILPVDQWLMVTGVVGSLYFGVNFAQKKLL